MKKHVNFGPILWRTQKTHPIFWFWGASWYTSESWRCSPHVVQVPPCVPSNPVWICQRGEVVLQEAAVFQHGVFAYLDDPSDLFVPGSLGTKHGHKPLLGFISPITKSNWSSKSGNERMELHQGVTLWVTILHIIYIHRYLPGLVVWRQASANFQVQDKSYSCLQPCNHFSIYINAGSYLDDMLLYRY